MSELENAKSALSLLHKAIKKDQSKYDVDCDGFDLGGAAGSRSISRAFIEGQGFTDGSPKDSGLKYLTAEVCNHDDLGNKQVLGVNFTDRSLGVGACTSFQSNSVTVCGATGIDKQGRPNVALGTSFNF